VVKKLNSAAPGRIARLEKFKIFYVHNQVPNAPDALHTSKITPVQCRFFCQQKQICFHANLV
jgi:hypothetical protein